MAIGYEGEFTKLDGSESVGTRGYLDGSESVGTRGFKYVDTDGDTLTVWRYEGGSVYMKARDVGGSGNTATVRVNVDHVDKLIEELSELKKNRCDNCGGTGYRG